MFMNKRMIFRAVTTAVSFVFLAAALPAQQGSHPDNGVLNARQFPGPDIGAQVNAAFAACPDKVCTVFVHHAHCHPAGAIADAGDGPAGLSPLRR
jgi:hypothetical protein